MKLVHLIPCFLYVIAFVDSSEREDATIGQKSSVLRAGNNEILGIFPCTVI